MDEVRSDITHEGGGGVHTPCVKSTLTLGFAGSGNREGTAFIYVYIRTYIYAVCLTGEGLVQRKDDEGQPETANPSQ